MEETKELEILIIEDDPKHLEDAKSEMDGKSVRVDYATSYKEAEKHLASKKYDGIISDIFFPWDDKEDYAVKGWNSNAAFSCRIILDKAGAMPKTDVNSSNFDYMLAQVKAMNKWQEASTMHPTGIIIAEKALEKGVPIVFCTDTYHHGYATQPIFDFARGKGIKMIDSERVGYEGRDKAKNWEKAFETLKTLIEQK